MLFAHKVGALEKPLAGKIDKELPPMTFALDHVAVPSHNIASSVEWYVSQLGAEVLYQDATWAFLRLGQGKLALVTPAQHPPHIAVRVGSAALEAASQAAQTPIDTHRDGTQGIYVSDPDGNQVELIRYPPGETTYE